MFIAFFKMGLFTIGGGLAMIPLMQKFAVDDQKWLTEEEMVDCIAISYSVPGVVAINAATFIGKKKFGMTGAVIATLGVTLPSLFCIIAIVLFLGQIENNKYVQGAFVGLTAAACGLIANAMVRLAKQSIKNVFGWIVAVGAFAAITLFDVNAILVILISAVSGYVYMLATSSRAESAGASAEAGEDGGSEEKEDEK